MARIAVVGVGSIGSVLARGFDELGHPVAVNDIDRSQVDATGLPFKPIDEISDWAEYIIVAVPTPTTDNGGDASAVRDVVSSVTPTDATVLLRSTMPPGSTRRLADSADCPLVYSPEFLRDRSGVDDFFHPDRIVLAGPREERERVKSLLDDVRIQCDTVIEQDDYLTAELGKYAHNAFFATKVSFANQMRTVAERAGADAATVMDIVTADGRNTSSHLDPMLGPYGGSCLPKDLGALRAFAHDEGIPTPVLDGTHRMNELAKDNYEYKDIQGNWPNITVTSD